jgi:peptide/nickel transport system permease protein
MLVYAIRRTLFAFVSFLAITLIAFVLFHVIPAGPLPPSSRPFFVQYLDFLWQLVSDHDLGSAFGNRRRVDEIVLQAAPVTASVVFGGALLWLALAVPLGVLAGLRPRSLVDRLVLGFIVIGISVHPVWLGFVLSYLAGYKLTWMPIAGYCEAFSPPEGSCGGVGAWAYHLVLPWLTLAVVFTALYTRMIRTSVIETMQEDYVRTARAKGSPEGRVIGRHVLRSALLPVVTMLGMDIGIALGGALYVETVFGLPGLGVTAFQSADQGDLPVLQGVALFASGAVIALNLVIDLAYGLLDPRIRVA